MSRALPNPRAIYSFDDLLQIEEITGLKYELLDGHIVAMTGGTKAHNLIALGLFTEMDTHKDARCRLYNDNWTKNVYLGKQTDVEIDLGTEHQSIQLNLGKIYKYLENRI